MIGRGSRKSAQDTDLALRVTVAKAWAEVVGALLMDRLGPWAEEPFSGEAVTLVFYPTSGDVPSDGELFSSLPEELRGSSAIGVVREQVPRDWVDGWKDHFRPTVIGQVLVRPPWESPPDSKEGLIDVAINPGLGFGTGLHPTTRGTLTLMQEKGGTARSHGALVDAGTGSGILAIAGAKMGWKPVNAFDNDPVALESTRDNVLKNGVVDEVQVHECGVDEAPLPWFEAADVMANMTLEPVRALLRRVAQVRPTRFVVSGILAGAQEEELACEAEALGFAPSRRMHEDEWVSMELLPADSTAGD